MNIAMNLSRSYPEGAGDWLTCLASGRPARTSAARSLPGHGRACILPPLSIGSHHLQDSELRSVPLKPFTATIGFRNDLATRSLALVGDQKRIANLGFKDDAEMVKIEPEAAAAWLKSWLRIQPVSENRNKQRAFHALRATQNEPG